MLLSATLDNLLNRGLPRSPRARQLCTQLAGKSLALEVADIARLRVSCNGQTLTLERDSAPADAELRGGPLSLLALAGPDAQALVQRGDVVIGGDAQVAQQFQELLALLKPDFEEELSLVVGDVPAHQAARLARLALQFGRRAAGTTLQNLAEYLGHERGDLVPRHEGEQYLRGVDTLREAVDRLEARLDALARRRGAP